DAPSEFDGGPEPFVRFVAVGPVVRQTMIAARADQLETAAALVSPLRPTSAGAIRHLIHDDVMDIWPSEILIRARNYFRHGQSQTLASSGQFAFEITD